MILVWIIFIPIIGGLLARLSGAFGKDMPRWVSLFTLVLDLFLVGAVWSGAGLHGGRWLAQAGMDWIPQLGIGFHLAMDGLSLILVALTLFLGICAVVSSWTEVTSRVGLFHLNIMFTLAGIIGAFLAMDLFLFYFFWELMLVPMFLIIALWGHERRRYASIKFFIFTQAGSLLMLVAILALFFIHGRATGVYTFSYAALLATTPMDYATEFLLMLAFFAAFAVKLPVFPLHTWLPEAHTEAPTAGSVILAGLLLKTGGYGLIRFVLPLFPEASVDFAPVAFILAVIGIIYGAVLAFGQTDLKRFVAYTSVSHMGFVLLGVYAWNELALQGALMQMVAHGISTGALFMLAGALQERLHTRELTSMGGFWSSAPKLGAVGLIFVLASLGLPGLGNFAAEFLVLLGTFSVSPEAAILAASGLVLSAVYSLWIVQRVFHGPSMKVVSDLKRRETAAFASMAVLIVWLGLFPQPVLDLFGQTLRTLNVSAVKPLGASEDAVHRAGPAVYNINYIVEDKR